MTFESDEARRAYFLELLREKLKDPEFRKIEGFPIGADEDILVLSDPPFYTACPNPFLEEFVRQHATTSASGNYEVAESFAFDVTEGKQDPVCMAHTYHTKVPYRAIARYILHYTRPDDLVLHCFAGTGMTGVAAHTCASPSTTLKKAFDKERADASQPPPLWGRRFVILSDLSPFATFLGHNFNSNTSPTDFSRDALSLLAQSEQALGWMYETDDQATGSRGQIQYVIWSESVYCECGQELLCGRLQLT